jgi:nicotinamide-nucleotide amidase
MKTLQPLIERIIERLRERKETVTFAESCTGGRLAAALTSVSGASDVFEGSCVVYANRIKHAWLGVSDETLQRYGAVSRQCVEEMLEGILKMSDASCAVAVSGIAGPTGGTPQTPVGTVYIGVRTPQKSEVFHCLFDGDREAVQMQSVRFAYEKLAEFLEIE